MNFKKEKGKNGKWIVTHDGEVVVFNSSAEAWQYIHNRRKESKA